MSDKNPSFTTPPKAERLTLKGILGGPRIAGQIDPERSAGWPAPKQELEPVLEALAQPVDPEDVEHEPVREKLPTLAEMLTAVRLEADVLHATVEKLVSAMALVLPPSLTAPQSLPPAAAGFDRISPAVLTLMDVQSRLQGARQRLDAIAQADAIGAVPPA